MGYFIAVIVTILYCQCLSQTITYTRLPSNTGDDRLYSTPRKNVINSVLDSLINAIHPVEETQNQGGNFPINSNWELSDEQDTANPDSSTNAITSTDESVSVSEVANQSEDEDEESALPDDGKENEPFETNKHGRPFIQSVIEPPKPPKIRIKPKLNITQLLHIKSTTGKTSFAKEFYNSFTSTTKKRGIENPYLASKMPGIFNTAQPTVKPVYGPTYWHKAPTSSYSDNLSNWVTWTPWRTASTPKFISNRKTTSINGLLDDKYMSDSDLPSTLSDLEMENMIKRINMLVNLYNKTTQTNDHSSTTLEPTTATYDMSSSISPWYDYVLQSGTYEHGDNERENGDNDYNAKLEMLQDIFQKWKAKKPQLTSTQAPENLDDDMAKKGPDEFEPIKLEIPIFVDTNINPSAQPSYNFEEMIGKINSMLTTPSTLTTKNEENVNRFLTTKTKMRSTNPTKRRQNGRNSTKQTFGPNTAKTTVTPIIGPMISSTTGSALINDLYNPVTLPGIHVPARHIIKQKSSSKARTTITTEPTTETTSTTESILNVSDGQDSSIEQDPLIIQFEEAASKVSKKHKFPWPINRQKHSNPSTAANSNEQGLDELYNKMDENEPDKIKPIISYPENIKTSTIPRESHETHLWKKEPVLKSTTLTSLTKKPRSKSTPKLPTWLSNMFSTIIPKTTTKKSDYSVETMVPLMTTQRTTKNELNDMEDKQNKPLNNDKSSAVLNITDKPNWSIPERNNNYQGGREGNYAGSHSGQSLNGVGVNNGQAGIIIGQNSGNGRKPHNKPMLAKPIASYAYKPALLGE